MHNPLDQILAIIKKTGDNCIVVDGAGNPQYVLMAFDRYQKIQAGLATGKTSVAGLTENELLNKINQDISDWKASVGQENLNFENLVKAMDESTDASQSQANSWQADLAVPLISEDPFLVKNSLNKAKKEHDTEKTEEKYYFEPID